MSEHSTPTVPSQCELYEQDETAWLEEMSRLVAERRFEDLDCKNLSEYLSDIAKRDRREVLNRLITLLVHLLKWEHQPGMRSNSWSGIILEQQGQLEDLLESGSLRRHAKEVLEKAYKRAVRQAAKETGLPRTEFAAECSMSLEQILSYGEEE